MKVYLVDGTYELFRHFFAVPKAADRQGHEVGAMVGVLNSLLSMVSSGVTHLAVATDHVIESFRNDLWHGYKTGEGIDPLLYGQFDPLERAIDAMGITIWPMVEFEADDALASAAMLASRDPRVEQVVICTPDKDLAQAVVGDRVVQLDRRLRKIFDEGAVSAKFGVLPASIPDYLALVGDSADGYPGIGGWGAKSAASVLNRYGHLEAIPPSAQLWDVSIRAAARLSAELEARRSEAMLFRRLATLRTDIPLFDDVDELRWRGPTAEFEQVAAELGAPGLWERAIAEEQRDRGTER